MLKQNKREAHDANQDASRKRLIEMLYAHENIKRPIWPKLVAMPSRMDPERMPTMMHYLNQMYPNCDFFIVEGEMYARPSE